MATSPSFRTRASYALDSAGDATTLTNTMDLRAPGPLNLLTQLATRRVQEPVAANLRTLKELLEHG